MRAERAVRSLVVGLILASGSGVSVHGADEAAGSVIRLGSAQAAAGPRLESPGGDAQAAMLRSFDSDAFGERFEASWFRRKALLRNGRDDDAAREADSLRALVAEEGVRRLDVPTVALLAEAGRFRDEGNHDRARAALALAESLDPGRPEIRFLRASVVREAGGGLPAAGWEWIAGLTAALRRALSSPALLHVPLLAAASALFMSAFLFAALMAVRYHALVRHDVEEWLTRSGRKSWAFTGAWAVLLWPLALWLTAGWIAVYWLVLTFRYLRRAERVVAIVMLLGMAAGVPLHRLAVGAYGMTADPRTRTMLAAASGAYDPDVVDRLRALVRERPDDPNYRFLLAGVYGHGRFFEESFLEYKKVLEIAPETYQAHINIGNLFFRMGQHGEAIAEYRRALEARDDSVLAYCNMYLAQTESFRLNEAARTFARAREIDADEAARILARGDGAAGRPMVVDATIDLGAIWKAALGGHPIEDWLDADRVAPGWGRVAAQIVNPLSLFCFFAAAACMATVRAARGGTRALRCIRCGRPFCPLCKTSREGPDYCTQCLHLFVLQDGLAPETKTRKLYEIEAHGRRRRWTRRAWSALVPGSGTVLAGRPALGMGLAAVWLVAVVACVPAAGWPIERLLGLDVRLDGLSVGSSALGSPVDPTFLLAAPLAAVAWLTGNLALRRVRET